MSHAKKMTFLLLGTVLVLAALVAAYLFLFARPNAALQKSTVVIDGATFHVELARTTTEEARGLSFRPSLGEDEGMLFFFDKHPSIQSFWMKDMQFPIDIIWIGGGKVLGFSENAAPQPGTPLWGLKIYNSPDGTDRVLEVNAGTVAKYHIKEGDAVEMDIEE